MLRQISNNCKEDESVPLRNQLTLTIAYPSYSFVSSYILADL